METRFFKNVRVNIREHVPEDYLAKLDGQFLVQQAFSESIFIAQETYNIYKQCTKNLPERDIIECGNL